MTIQTGMESGITILANGSYSKTITYSKPFNTVPSVVASPMGGRHITVNIDGLTTTSFVLTVLNHNSDQLTGRIVQWIAIGK